MWMNCTDTDTSTTLHLYEKHCKKKEGLILILRLISCCHWRLSRICTVRQHTKR